MKNIKWRPHPLGMFLGVCLVDRIAREGGCAPLIRAPAGVAFVLISLQMVNTAASYTACVAALGLIMATAQMLRGVGGGLHVSNQGAAVLAGAFAGALPVLKLTHAPLVFGYLGVLALILFSRKDRWTLACLLAGALAISVPWALMAYLNHAQLLAQFDLREGVGVALSSNPGALLGLFGSGDLFWGATLGSYQAVWSLVFVGLIPGGVTWAQRRSGNETLVAAGLLGGLGLLALGLWTCIVDADNAIRYQAPILCVAAVVTGVTLNAALAAQFRTGWSQRAVTLTAAGALLFISLAFAGDFVARGDRAHAHKFLFSYPLPANIPAHQAATDPSVGSILRAVQGVTEVGSPILALVGVPVLLDFARNPIYALHGTVLGAPWMQLPTDDPAALHKFLRGLGVRYILWQARGVGVMPPGLLAALAHHSSRAITGPAGVLRDLHLQIPRLAELGTVELDNDPFLVIAL